MARQMPAERDDPLADVVSNSVTYHGDLPDFEVFRAVAETSQRTIEAVAEVER